MTIATHTPATTTAMSGPEPLCGDQRVRDGKRSICDNRAGHKPPETHYDSYTGEAWL
jgi:hypothetical protein